MTRLRTRAPGRSGGAGGRGRTWRREARAGRGRRRGGADKVQVASEDEPQRRSREMAEPVMIDVQVRRLLATTRS